MIETVNRELSPHQRLLEEAAQPPATLWRGTRNGAPTGDHRQRLYSSHLVTRRTARDRGELEGLRPKKRGPKVVPPDPRDKKIAEQEREIARLPKRAERAEGLLRSDSTRLSGLEQLPARMDSRSRTS